MPTYSYRCTECDNAFDIHQAFTDDSLTVCDVCGGRLRKLFNTIGVTFNGSGFYRTDSRGRRREVGVGCRGRRLLVDGSASGGSSSGGSSSGGSSRRLLRAARRAAPPAPSSGGSSSSGSGSTGSGSSASVACRAGAERSRGGSVLKGFREFILRGNVIELAVAVVIGAAFTAVVNAIVANLINPLIGALFHADSLDNAMVISILTSTARPPT